MEDQNVSQIDIIKSCYNIHVYRIFLCVITNELEATDRLNQPPIF